MGLIIVLIVASAHWSIAEDSSPYQSPWIGQADINLYKLIQQGYQIIDIHVKMPLGGSFVEIIYLRKGDRIYRCVTLQVIGEKAEHGCELLTDPTKKDQK